MNKLGPISDRRRVARVDGRRVRQRRAVRREAGGGCPHVHEGCRADPLQELHVVPPPGRDRPDVAPDLRRGAALGEIDPRRGERGDDAAVACGRAEGDVPQRARADGGRKRHPGQVGERRRTEGGSRTTCRRCRRTPTAGCSASRTRSSRCRSPTSFPPTARSNTSTSTSRPTSPSAKWVKSIEVRPGNREVVHHVLVYYRANPDMQRAPVMPPERASSRARRRRSAKGSA